MTKPIQLIIDDIKCPTTTRDRYQCYPEQLRELLQMADGTVVEADLDANSYTVR